MQRRTFFMASAGILAIPGIKSAFAQVVNLNDAINKAGRQRMLSQRLAKAYLQIGQSIDLDRSRRILDTSMALFDRQLIELKAFPPARDIRGTLADQEKTWAGYKEVLVGAAPSLDGARKVLAMSEELLASAQAATVQLEKIAASNTARLVNIAGRQRMLSQRMAKFYQAMRWRVAPAEAGAELEKSRREFAVAHEELATSPRNTPEIRSELELVQVQWTFFDNALRNLSPASMTAQMATNVATTSERILDSMDRVTGLYDKLS